MVPVGISTPRPAAHRDALRLRTALIATSFGNGLTGVVLTIQIASTYQGAGVSAAMLALSIGMLFSFASGGLHADRANRVRSLVMSDFLRCLANLAIVVGLLSTWAGGIALIVAACFVNGICAGYFRPALSSLWAALTPSKELQKVLATNSLLNRVALAAGGALGGILIAINQGTLGIAIDSATFLLSALILLFNAEPAREEAEEPRGSGDPGNESLRARTLRRLNVVAQWKTLFSAGRKSSWFNLWTSANIAYSLISGVVSVCLPLALVQHYSAGEIGLYSSISVIALLLGALGARFIRRLPFPGMVAAWANCGNCLSSALVAVGSPAAVAACVRFTAYACTALSSPALSSFVARQFSPDERGKVYAMQTGASSVLAPLGMLLAGVLLLWCPAAWVLAVSCACGCVVCAVPLLRKAAWHFAIES